MVPFYLNDLSLSAHRKHSVELGLAEFETLYKTGLAYLRTCKRDNILITNSKQNLLTVQLMLKLCYHDLQWFSFHTISAK